MLYFLVIINSIINSIINFAQSAEAVEYTDCTSAEGLDPSMSILDMTLNSLMVRSQ